MNVGITSSEHQDNIDDLRFSKYYLLRIKGIEQRDIKLMEESNNGLKFLCRDEHPAALYVMGKELIMLKENLKDFHARKAQEQARYFLSLSCEKNFAPAYFYLGLAHELGFGGPVNKSKALELYNQSKELGDPQAYFQLSKIEKASGNLESSMSLLKVAAEIGLLEAQHNLAVEYSEQGEELKSLAWFLNAAKYNFFPSMVNVGMIFLQGNKQILANPLAAYIWLSSAQTYQDSPELKELVANAQAQIANIRKNGT